MVLLRTATGGLLLVLSIVSSAASELLQQRLTALQDLRNAYNEHGTEVFWGTGKNCPAAWASPVGKGDYRNGPEMLDLSKSSVRRRIASMRNCDTLHAEDLHTHPLSFLQRAVTGRLDRDERRVLRRADFNPSALLVLGGFSLPPSAHDVHNFLERTKKIRAVVPHVQMRMWVVDPTGSWSATPCDALCRDETKTAPSHTDLMRIVLRWVVLVNSAPASPSLLDSEEYRALVAIYRRMGISISFALHGGD